DVDVEAASVEPFGCGFLIELAVRDARERDDAPSGADACRSLLVGRAALRGIGTAQGWGRARAVIRERDFVDRLERDGLRLTALLEVEGHAHECRVGVGFHRGPGGGHAGWKIDAQRLAVLSRESRTRVRSNLRRVGDEDRKTVGEALVVAALLDTQHE